MRLARTMLTTTSALLAGAAFGLWTSTNTRRAPESRSPTSIVEIARRSLRDALDDGVLSVAAAIAFYALLSLVPALSVMISVYGLLTVPSAIPGQIEALNLPIPLELRDLILDQVRRIASTSTTTLSLTLVTSVAIASWSANAAVKAMFEGLDRMWDLRETRSFLVFNATSLGFTVVAVMTVVAMLAAFAMLPALQALAGDRLPSLLGHLRWPVLLCLGLVVIFLLYRHGPDRAPPRAALQLPGAIFATVVWVGTSAAFSWYAATLGTYSATYGSLAGVVVVLTWSWLSSLIVLSGGAITAVLEKRDRG